MTYDIIIADPPWDYGGKNCLAKKSCFSNNEEGQHYQTTKSKNLYDVAPYLQRVASKDSLLFMWCSGATLVEATELMKAWGWTYATTAFVWDKQVGTTGYYTRPECEFVLVGKRGKIPRPYLQAKLRQLVSVKKGKHSVKPEEVQDRIEEMFSDPKFNKLELFARRHRPGWKCLGNELDGLDIRDALVKL
jgi:N6-adenosine-specific RNA methylase IME4